MNNKLIELANEYNIIVVNKLHKEKDSDKIISTYAFAETESLNAFLNDKRFKELRFQSVNKAAYELYCQYNIILQQQQQFFVD